MRPESAIKIVNVALSVRNSKDRAIERKVISKSQKIINPSRRSAVLQNQGLRKTSDIDHDCV